MEEPTLEELNGMAATARLQWLKTL
jgi:hypothetical protein